MRALSPLRLAGPQLRVAVAAAALAATALLWWHWRMIASVPLPQDVRGWNADLYTAFYPVHRFAYRSPEWLPLWNPYQLAGTPFLADYNGVLYPPNFLAKLVQVHRALGWVSALHVAFAGLGTFACVRPLGLTVPAAFLAGVLYMLNGYFLFAFIQPSHLEGYAWIPFVFLASGRLLAEPGAYRGAVLGVTVALQVLTASAQTVCYEAYALATAGIAYLVARRAWRARLVGQLLGAVLVAIAVTVLLAAVQVLPTLELASAATRGHLTVEQTLPDRPSMALVLKVVVSSGPAVVLALLAPFGGRMAVIAAAIALFAFAILIGIGTPLYAAVFYHLPLVDHFRVPNRILLFAVFALAILAAIGLDALRSWSAGRGVPTLFLLAAGVGLWTESALDIWGGAVVTAGLLVALMPADRLRAAAAWLLVAVVVAGRFAQRGNTLMIPEHNADAFFEPPPVARFLREHVGVGRVLIIPDWSHRFPLTEKAGSVFGFAAVQDYEPLAPRVYHDFLAPLDGVNVDAPLFWGRFYPEPDDPGWRLLDLMAVRWVVVTSTSAWRPRPERYPLVYDDGKFRVYENPRALPRASLLPVAEVIPAEDAAIARVHAPDFDPHAQVVVDRPLAWRTTGELPAVAQSAEIERITADELIVRVSTPRPAILVLTDLEWPGWRVRVDGEERQIARADGLFRAVAVEAGVHVVGFKYAPWSVWFGAATSVATALALAGAVAVRARR